MGQSLCKGFILENYFTLKATGGAICNAPKECGICLCTSHLHQDQGSTTQSFVAGRKKGIAAVDDVVWRRWIIRQSSAAGVCGLTGVPGRGSSFKMDPFLSSHNLDCSFTLSAMGREQRTKEERNWTKNVFFNPPFSLQLLDILLQKSHPSGLTPDPS